MKDKSKIRMPSLSVTRVNRTLSLVVVSIFIILIWTIGKTPPMRNIIASLGMVMVLSFIWFGEFWGGLIGIFANSRRITASTPGFMVTMMGWFLLVGVPLILYSLSK
ncbi:MAG: hypothetical protein AABZ60_11735 [Planctomycetota bacterium]